MLKLSLETNHRLTKLTKLCEWSQTSPKCSIILIYFAIIIDNLLLTSVVPVIPDYLNKLDVSSNKSSSILPIFKFSFNSTNSKFNNLSVNFNTGMLVQSSSSFDDENGQIGLLLSSKAFVQLICNPFVGAVINRFGYEMTQIFGSSILLFSSILYATGESFGMLFIPRCIQGIASAFITVSGMAMIANMYPNQEKRCAVMGFTLGGMATGVLIGYPFGSFTYDFFGKSAPFSIIAFITFSLIVCQSITFNWSLSNSNNTCDISFIKLLSDKYIIVAIGAICVSTTSMSILESCLPLWLLENMDPTPKKWQLGTVFIPDSIGYLIGTNFLISCISYENGRWLTVMSSLALVGLSAITIPMATNISHLIFPHFGLGLGIGTIDAAIMPFLAHIVDKKFFTLYGSVYAIAQTSVCLAYSLGPLISGQLIKLGIEFSTLIRAVGFINLMYCPLCFLLRNVDRNELNEQKAIISDGNERNDYSTIDPNVGRYVQFIDQD